VDLENVMTREVFDRRSGYRFYLEDIEGETVLVKCIAPTPQQASKVLNIPDCVQHIGPKAFEETFKEVEGPLSVTLPNGLLSIGAEAFKGIPNLHWVNLPNSIASIGDGAFEDCTSLQLPTTCFHSALIHIGARALANCCSIRTISLPGRMQYIGGDAFKGCKAKIKWRSAQAYACYLVSLGTTYEEDTEKNRFFFDESQTLSICVSSDGKYIEPITDKFNNSLYIDKNGVLLIYRGPHGGEIVGNVLVPPEVFRIGSHAFAGNNKLNNVFLPPSIQAVHADAFQDCTGGLIIYNHNHKSVQDIKLPFAAITKPYPKQNNDLTSRTSRLWSCAREATEGLPLNPPRATWV
jgi:hypothetical protein